MTRSSNGGNYPRGAAISAHGLSCGSSVLISEDAFMGRAVRRLLNRQNNRALGKSPMATPNCSTYGHPNCPRQDG